MLYRLHLASLTLLLGLVACTPKARSTPPLPSTLNLVTVDPNATTTPTPFLPSTAEPTPLPTPTRWPTETTLPPTATATATASDVPTAALLPASLERTQYTFFVTFDCAGHVLQVEENIRYPNLSGHDLPQIVLAVEPNLWPGVFTLTDLRLEDTPQTAYTLNGHRLEIALPQPLRAGEVLKLALNFTLKLPPQSVGSPFGYGSNQSNLTDWFPFIVPYQGEWVLHDPWSFGEHLVYDAADFEVNLKVNDPQVIVAASAPAESTGEWRRYRLSAARTFAFSASENFRVAESRVGSVVIRSYYFAGQENAGERMAISAAQAVSIFQTKLVPYPYSSLSIVAADVPDGQEFDGFVLLSTKFYNQYQQGIGNNLVDIGVHEIAHQWWFGLVGNDQALEPWLDEALATYSEHFYYEYYDLTNWWWNFRVNYFSPSGWVDTSIYNGGSFRTYTNAVYLNGANFLEAVRRRVGEQDFFNFLQDYLTRYAHQRATAYDFFATLRANTAADVSDLIRAYFQSPY
ncbi:MAG: M1 family metallopeptidase [Anaerolineae bacterium]